MKPTIVLASSSPRRADLLKAAGLPFETQAANVDERAPTKADAPKVAIEIALRKAKAVSRPTSFVLAADTLIDHDGALLGKPADELEAHALLRMLSGDTHRVVTGVVVVPPGGAPLSSFAETKVTFRELTDQEIDAYVRTGDPLDKAGGYGIQGRAKAFVSKVDGPMDNVIGLPMDVVRRLLREAGYPLGP